MRQCSPLLGKWDTADLTLKFTNGLSLDIFKLFIFAKTKKINMII